MPEVCHHSPGGFPPMAREEGLQELQGYMVSVSSPSTMTTFSPCLYMPLTLRKTLIGLA